MRVEVVRRRVGERFGSVLCEVVWRGRWMEHVKGWHVEEMGIAGPCFECFVVYE